MEPQAFGGLLDNLLREESTRHQHILLEDEKS